MSQANTYSIFVSADDVSTMKQDVEQVRTKIEDSFDKLNHIETKNDMVVFKDKKNPSEGFSSSECRSGNVRVSKIKACLLSMRFTVDIDRLEHKLKNDTACCKKRKIYELQDDEFVKVSEEDLDYF